MFAKYAQFRVHTRGLAHGAGITAAPCNDNRRAGRIVAGLARKERPVLVCRWHMVASTGALACTWQTEQDASASEEPAIGWRVDLLQRLRPRYRRRAAVAAAGVL